LSLTSHGHSPGFGASSGLPSPRQFIIGSSFLQGKPSMSASVPRSFPRSPGGTFLFFRRSPISWIPRNTQLQRLRSRHHSHPIGMKTAAYHSHIFLRRAVQTLGVAARSHRRSRTSLRDRSSIPSTATLSVPHLTPWLLPHYLTYATDVGESVTSFAPSRLYGGKNGGRGFRGPFLSFSSSFACGGGGANEGSACFSFGVRRIKRCHDTRRHGGTIL